MDDVGGLLLIFALAWLLACAAASMLGGWYELASLYASRQPLEGRKFTLSSGSIGRAMQYGGCLFATVGAAGIAVSVLFIFRFMHPRLVIPWSAIERCEKTRGWFMDRVALRIVGFDRPLFLGGALGDAVLRQAVP